MTKCSNCKKSIDVIDKFCIHCGHKNKRSSKDTKTMHKKEETAEEVTIIKKSSKEKTASEESLHLVKVHFAYVFLDVLVIFLIFSLIFQLLRINFYYSFIPFIIYLLIHLSYYFKDPDMCNEFYTHSSSLKLFLILAGRISLLVTLSFSNIFISSSGIYLVDNPLGTGLTVFLILLLMILSYFLQTKYDIRQLIADKEESSFDELEGFEKDEDVKEYTEIISSKEKIERSGFVWEQFIADFVHGCFEFATLVAIFIATISFLGRYKSYMVDIAFWFCAIYFLFMLVRGQFYPKKINSITPEHLFIHFLLIAGLIIIAGIGIQNNLYYFNSQELFPVLGALIMLLLGVYEVYTRIK